MPNGAATPPVQALPQELCKETVDEWNDTAGDYVRAKMFDRKQFVTDADLEMGGHIQKLVAFELHIVVPNDRDSSGRNMVGGQRSGILFEKNGRRLRIP